MLHSFDEEGPKVGLWDQVSLARSKRSATVRRFGQNFRTEATSWMPRIVGFTKGKRIIPRFEHHGCIEVAMQGIGAHKNGVLVAMWLECYVLLPYFERGSGPKGGFGVQVSLPPPKGTSTVPRFCRGKNRGRVCKKGRLTTGDGLI